MRARSSRHRAGVLTLLALALVLVAGVVGWPQWRDRAVDRGR